MKKALIKALIIFISSLICGYVLWLVFSDLDAGRLFNYNYSLVIFIEIAMYGSLIIYEVSKKGGDEK